jgi:hypothetical protein
MTGTQKAQLNSKESTRGSTKRVALSCTESKLQGNSSGQVVTCGKKPYTHAHLNSALVGTPQDNIDRLAQVVDRTLPFHAEGREE